MRSGTSSGLNPVHNGKIGQEEPRGSTIGFVRGRPGINVHSGRSGQEEPRGSGIGFVHGRPGINMEPTCLATEADSGFSFTMDPFFLT